MTVDTKIKAVLFDLDGTLLDSIEGIATAANIALEEQDFPTHDVDDYRYFVGKGLPTLIRTIVPADASDEDCEACIEIFNEEYGELCYNDEPYEGILDMLDALVEMDMPIGVLSNKPHAFVCEMVDHYFGHIPFAYVSGVQEGVAPKPDPEGVSLALEAMDVMAEDVLFVGDTSTDMQTAVNSDMTGAGVSWGFRTIEELQEHGATIIIERPQEIVDYVTA